MKPKYKPLTEDEIAELIRPCPADTDDMFWRQDEELRIEREHREKFEKRLKKLAKRKS